LKYILVDDSVKGIGGTALTLSGLIEPVKEDLIQVATAELSMDFLLKNLDKVWIFGNIHALTPSSGPVLRSALSMVTFFKIEFDYGYCYYRGRIPHQVLGGCNCDCNTNARLVPYQELYSLIKQRAVKIFYMGQEQLEIHQEDLGLSKDNRYVLSSCFSPDFYPLIEKLKTTEQNEFYAIIDGQGGWHSRAKGVDVAINFATENNLPYKLLKTDSHTELLEQLSQHRGLIFLPLIHDTCPRITIEARLLNLELILNNLCQHITEEWWQRPRDEVIKYLKGRPDFLWKEINNGLS
jgi:hypothetical protein